MKKTFAILTAVSFSAQAQVDVRVGNVKNYLMTTNKEAQFTSGYSLVTIQDGSWFLAPCSVDPSQVIIQPIVNPPICILGTTGFVWRGDADRDGIRDDGSYWSLASVIKASVIKPFLADRVLLQAAPPSKLKRPIGNFTDESVGIYYNIITGPVEEYPITGYTYYKEYGFNEEKKHNTEYVPGVYIYSVPSIVNPDIKLSLRTQIYNAPESMAYAKGNRGFSITGTRWNKGSMELDPRLLTRVSWSGITPSNTVGTDNVYFSMYEAYPNTGDLVIPSRILYPTPDVPYKLLSPFITTLEIIPFAFQKGERAIARLHWTRNLATSAVATDVSQRTFDWRCRFVDSYEGHSYYELPVGTLEAERLGTADFDGDGVSNLVEFAFSQDDGDDIASTPEIIANAELQPVLPAMQVDPVSGQAFMNIEKRLNVGSAIIYTVQYSTNGKKWTTITAKNKLFDIIEDNEEVLRVRSKQSAPAVLFMRPVAKEWKAPSKK